MKSFRIILIAVLVLVLSISCAAKSEPVLSITGLKDASFTQKNLEGMTMIDSSYTNKDGATTLFSGISINGLLSVQGIDSFSELNIIASDGYSAAVTYDELTNCAGCILAYSNENGWSSVMPDFSGKTQVKDVVELSVK